VLLRLHFRDTLVAAAYPVVAPGDTTSPAAVVAVRYLIRDAARAFFFDSGAVQVRREREQISGRADGSGTEKRHSDPDTIQYHDVALPRLLDTVSCMFQP